jgi:hypothetical protein
LNRLYFDHQLSMMTASKVHSLGLRRAHLRNGAKIAPMIVRTQQALGACAAKEWELLAVFESLAPDDQTGGKGPSRNWSQSSKADRHEVRTP